MTASLAMMDWHCSMGRALAWGLVAAWNLSMPRAQRLKVVTPSDDTWGGGRQNQWAVLRGHRGEAWLYWAGGKPLATQDPSSKAVGTPQVRATFL